MIEHRNRVGALAIGAICLSLVSSSCGNHTPTAVESEAISSDGILSCDEPSAPNSEWYSVFAMRNKLLHYPDFAHFSRVKVISSCSDARTFFDDYESYEQAHPGFDQNEPYEPSPLPKPEEPTVVEPARVSIDKILNGNPNRLSPVVKLESAFSPGICSGSFIGRNWIITAAHCLARDSSWTAGAGDAVAKIHKYYPYTVTYGTNQGRPLATVDYDNVLQFVDPGYVGFRATHASPHDFALLYVKNDYDNDLPTDLPVPIDDPPYLRVSLLNAIPGAGSTIWGWGDPDAGTLLRSGSLSAYTLAQDTTFADGAPVNLFTASVPAAGGSANPYICGGDSGGPIVDRYDVGGAIVPVVAATLSSHSPPVDNESCAIHSTQMVKWVRIEPEQALIRASVKAYYPGFSCISGKKDQTQTDPTTPDDFMQCWGKRCQTTNDCGDPALACSHPGAELSNCEFCSDNTCGCMWGQCLPAGK